MPHARRPTDSMPAHHAALVAVTLALLSAPIAAKPICRWVDSNGRTQISDVVPERYQSIADCTDSQQYESSEQQRRAAEQRVEADRASAARDAAKPAAVPASGSTGPARAAPPRPAKRPAEVVTESTDCATWWRLYEESAACFGPYRTTRGGIRAEAFEACNVIASPEAKCGPRVAAPR